MSQIAIKLMPIRCSDALQQINLLGMMGIFFETQKKNKIGVHAVLRRKDIEK